MTLIAIEPLSNGAHENKFSPIDIDVPDGWAVIPDSIALPDSFPFVDIETEAVDNVQTVISMTAKEVPVDEKELAAQEQARKDAEERARLPEKVKALQAALDDADALNVDQEYRLTLLELGITDTDTSNT